MALPAKQWNLGRTQVGGQEQGSPASGERAVGWAAHANCMQEIICHSRGVSNVMLLRI